MPLPTAPARAARRRDSVTAPPAEEQPVQSAFLDLTETLVSETVRRSRRGPDAGVKLRATG